MLSNFAMDKINNGWLLSLSFSDERQDETWFCSTPEKGIKRIQVHLKEKK